MNSLAFLLLSFCCFFGLFTGGSFLAPSLLLLTRGLGAVAFALPFVGRIGSNLRFCLTGADSAPRSRERGDLNDSRRLDDPAGREPSEDRRPLLRLGSPILSLLEELPA
jgi:hypothetical protein